MRLNFASFLIAFLLAALPASAFDVGYYIRTGTSSLAPTSGTVVFDLTDNTFKYYDTGTSLFWALSVPKSNLGASVAPTVANDVTQGYKPGSEWFNSSTSNLYKCVNNASGAAVWNLISGRIGSSDLTTAINAITTKHPEVLEFGGGLPLANSSTYTQVFSFGRSCTITAINVSTGTVPIGTGVCNVTVQKNGASAMLGSAFDATGLTAFTAQAPALTGTSGNLALGPTDSVVVQVTTGVQSTAAQGLTVTVEGGF